jgi:hypothetical protein
MMTGRTAFVSLGALAFVAGCSHAPAPVPVSAPPPAPAPGIVIDANSPELVVVCLLEGDERRLEIFKRDSGCILKYTKNGEPDETALSRRGLAHCLKILEQIEGHLKESGFQCGS